MDEVDVTRWACAYTNPHEERLARGELELRHFNVFFPVIKRAVVRQGREVISREPLFSRYLFVALEDNQDWRPACYARGVKHLLGSEQGFPALVPHGEIAKILERADSDGLIVVNPPPPRGRVKEGDHVHVTDGKFEGFSGICEKSARDRVLVLLSLFNTVVPTWIPRRAVLKTDL